jgi:hypothetical protein
MQRLWFVIPGYFLFTWWSLGICRADEPLPSHRLHGLIVVAAASDTPAAFEEARSVAELCRKRLISSGYEEENVKLLVAGDADAASQLGAPAVLKAVSGFAVLDKEDTVLMIIRAPARVDGGQELLMMSTNKAGAEGVELPLQDLLDKLGQSNSERQLIVVDGGQADTEAASSEGAPVFGAASVRLDPGQTLVRNRHTGRRGEHPLFIAAVCDGLSELADLSLDGRVKRDEFEHYMEEYFRTYAHAPRPEIASSKSALVEELAAGNAAAVDFDVAIPVDGPGQGMSASRERIITSMLNNAHHVLLVENRPDQCIDLLERALSYRPSGQLQKNIRRMWRTAVAATGRLPQAWADALEKKESLIVFVPKSAKLKQADGSQVSSGNSELLEISAKPDSEYVISKRFGVNFETGRLRIGLIEAEGGPWRISEEDLGAAIGVNADSASTAARQERLLEILRDTSADTAAEAN